jgi:hypothetical protein
VPWASWGLPNQSDRYGGPVWSDSPMASFSRILENGLHPISHGLLVLDHLHNLSIASWALPTPLYEIQILGTRFLSWVERFMLWALILILEHFGLRQTLMKHLLLLEVKPSRRLGIALELPSVWWVLGKFVKVGFTSDWKEAR